MKIKKYIFSALVLTLGVIGLTGCNSSNTTVEQIQYFDTPATNQVDHYFSNQVRFSNTGTSITKDSNGKYAGDFILDKVAKLTLKSVTDGDTAVFYLNDGTTPDTFTAADPTGVAKSYPYVTIRFLGIDTPESTSSIEPWGKAASNYAKTLLKDAEGIIVDASDLENNASRNYIDRLDSNGSRWLGLVWYCPKGGDPEDLTQYRSYQLDMIEECYSGYGSFSTTRVGYTASRDKEPILYSRYQTVKNLITNEDEARFGSLYLNELFFEADNRMQKATTKIRVQGEVDPNFDYNKTPTNMTITEALADIDNLINKGTYVSLTGVITRFVESNFYFEDALGATMYVYMGIDGNSIGDMFKVGDTIKISGRLCEYGGQYQMSGIIFNESTFVRVTDNPIALPAPINLNEKITAGTFNEDYVKSILGKLVTIQVTCDYCGSQSKNGAYSLTTTLKIPGLEDLESLVTGNGDYYSSIYLLQVRINGALVPKYAYEDYSGLKTSGVSKTYQVTGIMGIYLEEDYTKTQYPSYQIVVGNRVNVNESEIVEVQ